VFDAICPLVTKVHVEVAKMREQGREVIMIGDHGHPEVEGTMGQSQGGMYLVETPADVTRLKVGDENNLAFVTQTTLSVDDASQIIAALKARFPIIVGPKTHRRHRRRFGTGNAGAGSGYAPERIGRERSVGVVRHHRTRDFPVAEESVSRSILIRFGCRALESGISQCP
jgi:hypothetical protein